jgi:hypothetical protein
MRMAIVTGETHLAKLARRWSRKIYVVSPGRDNIW